MTNFSIQPSVPVNVMSTGDYKFLEYYTFGNGTSIYNITTLQQLWAWKN